MAINSVLARSQIQLHIHIDCVRADVRDALAENAAGVGSEWAPFPVPLAGHAYDAIAVSGENLDAVNPFVAMAHGIPGARGLAQRRHDCADQPIAVLGTDVDLHGRQ